MIHKVFFFNDFVNVLSVQAVQFEKHLYATWLEITGDYVTLLLSNYH